MLLTAQNTPITIVPPSIILLLVWSCIYNYISLHNPCHTRVSKVEENDMAT